MATETRICKIGYARVSTPRQKLDAQLDALTQAGCLKIFTDQVSGVKADRPGWDQLTAYVRPGDTVVITELSRMTRSLMH
jgi:DNA invertase Pin-like site-specific DNA recombinase